MKIAVDFDEVLSQTLANFLVFFRKHHGWAPDYEDFGTYWWGDACKMAREDIRDLVEHKYYPDPCFDRIEAIDGAAQAINVLAKHHELMIITGRLRSWDKKTHAWLERHMPDRFQKVVFADSYADLGNVRKKDKIMIDEKADLLIEDDLFFATDVAEKGIKVILFNKPWNKGKPAHHNIIRVDTWTEALDRVAEIEKTITIGK